MRMVDLIRKKRDGGILTEDEIRFLIAGYTAGDIPDYQMSAFAMAVLFRGMNAEETATLTDAMMRSGDTVDLSCFGELSVDKHSTGGVGDKTTLIVAPLVASLGGKLAKMSGRGLGHTGGTVDKLESIPGFRTTLEADEFIRQVQQIGVAVIGQSGNLTPADKKLYALRDVTATVDSLPLIASSIMSKKLAAGSRSIVLDVKVGSGAFMKTLEDARALAEEMVSIGKACGRRVSAVLSNMDIPLGDCVGNALEVMEAVEVLRGGGSRDLRELCVVLSANMLSLVHGWTPEESRNQAEAALNCGKAYETMRQWITAQGGEAAVLDDTERFFCPAVVKEVYADRSGYIVQMDAQKVGEASVLLGAGRAQKDDAIDHEAGIRLRKKTGDYAETGEPIAVLYTNRRDTLPAAETLLKSAYVWSDTATEQPPLIYGIVR